MQELKKGNRYTITANRSTEDRSYTTGVHIVEVFNDTHVQTTYHSAHNGPRVVVLIRSEHIFSPAEDFTLPTGFASFAGMDEALSEADADSEPALN